MTEETETRQQLLPDELHSTADPQPELLVFADDWGRHPSSCQHLISRLLPRYRTTWVNTIGMRSPRFDLQTIRRGIEKLSHWSPAAQADALQLPENLTLLNPYMWPEFRTGAGRAMNRRLLTCALRQRVLAANGPVIGITTLPIVADLMDRLGLERWVYYCVDDFSTWPGLDHRPLEEMEELLISGVDRLIAVSENLHDRLSARGREARLLPHGIDLDFWSVPQSPGGLPQPASATDPLIVFWGLIDRRMDVKFVHRLADDLDSGTVLLAGPQDCPDPALLRHPKVVATGALPRSELPGLAQRARVLIMPYDDLPVTQAMQPLKLLEYLATSCPVVVRNLPATRDWTDCLDLAETATEFSRLVRQRLREGLPASQRAARRRLEHESWEARAAEFERILVD
ncbi:MAG: glycosyltransferase [Planctomycetaceae bacterium]|nr:glycosyltransferase [Planctomycetaceae bacterium]